MNNVIRMVPQDSLQELLTLLEWSKRARKSGHHKAADSFMDRALVLALEIRGDR